MNSTVCELKQLEMFSVPSERRMITSKVLSFLEKFGSNAETFETNL